METTKKKLYYNYEDVMDLFDVSESVARRILREIRAFCGWSPIPKGKVTIVEFDRWYNSKQEKNDERQG